MKAMSAKKIAQLNALCDHAWNALTEDQREQTNKGQIMVQVARDAGLELVKWYDQSGGLYRDLNARTSYVFGWESGGFDDQIEGE